MKLAQVLFSQGFGSRRECAARILDGRVTVGGRVCDDPDEAMVLDGLVFEVDGRPWPYHAKALLMLNKPAGYECSLKPRQIGRAHV